MTGQVNWVEIASHVMDLAIAYVLALPIGWDRERKERSAGIRTFPLVAIASCGFVLVAIRVLGIDSIGQARILEGLITGVGFIGGGAILKHSAGASGTATAASLWATGAVGGAVGYGLYDIAVILSVVTYATLRWMAPLKEVARTDDEGLSAGAQPASAADRATLRS
ncbi:magnesium transporter MgtC [Roseateles aquatilis]|uniref:Protein MgtC n=1 Tax=Roseateles aquatilis TaxID=431061 RepID=A0A246JGL6_9BURK|nr:MgtC/SapB family protein [Roseateles aquatilis]OWQ91397.1 magnesium transporter MgtC [Roseateles aquatilis]